MAAALLVVLASGAAARDLLVMVENRAYRGLPEINLVLDRRAIQAAARAAGFDILQLTDATGTRMQGRFGERMAELLAADRLVVVLAGHVVGDGEAHWLLGTDAPRRSDPFRAGATGLRIDAVLRILAGKPGGGLLLVAPGPGLEVAGPGLVPGFRPEAVPQGVTVVSGPAGQLSGLLAEDVLPGRVSVARSIEARGLQGAGFLPRVLSPLGAPAPAVVAEAEAWQQAAENDTVQAYEAFLSNYPASRFRSEAELRLAELRARPELVERELALPREARREVQQNLAVLGHDPRGVDGIFGPGTRAAIRAWQQAEGYPVNGYLTGNQVVRLQDAGAARRAALAAEAEARDRALWAETGQGDSAEGLRRYLSRFPDGLYAEEARDRLQRLEGAQREAARAADREAWDAARTTDTIAAYERYLSDQPTGAFRETAAARLRALETAEVDAGAVARAQAAEAQIANPITRLLVERRLQQLGQRPGTVDGQFDEATRAALRRYQRARGLTVTGYVSQETLLTLLSGN